MNNSSKVTSKGQVTIPFSVRKTLNIEEGDQLIFETVGEYEVKVKVVKNRSLSSLLGALPKKAATDQEFKQIRKQAYAVRTEERYRQE